MIIGWSEEQVAKYQIGLLADSEFGFYKNNSVAPNNLYNTGPVRNKSDNIYQ